MVTKYWICKNDECSEFDGQIFTSSPELAICPSCGRRLDQIYEDYDEEERDARLAAGLDDKYLARAHVAALTQRLRKEITICEAEILKRYGPVDPFEWTDHVILYGGRVFDSGTKRWGIMELEYDKKLQEIGISIRRGG